LTPNEARAIEFPSEKELKTLSPEQLQELLSLLESPWET
jgi:hypothetical protein